MPSAVIVGPSRGSGVAATLPDSDVWSSVLQAHVSVMSFAVEFKEATLLLPGLELKSNLEVPVWEGLDGGSLPVSPATGESICLDTSFAGSGSSRCGFAQSTWWLVGVKDYASSSDNFPDSSWES